MIWVGIDPGTHTGVAVWDSEAREFLTLETIPLHRALLFITNLAMAETDEDGKPNIKVVFEDARQRKWYGKGDASAKAQGAGSVKRDSAIWEDFCKDYDIPFEARPPMQGGTKVTSQYFKMISHYKGRTSNHARDAAMLVIGR